MSLFVTRYPLTLLHPLLQGIIDIKRPLLTSSIFNTPLPRTLLHSLCRTSLTPNSCVIATSSLFKTPFPLTPLHPCSQGIIDIKRYARLLQGLSVGTPIPGGSLETNQAKMSALTASFLDAHNQLYHTATFFTHAPWKSTFRVSRFARRQHDLRCRCCCGRTLAARPPIGSGLRRAIVLPQLDRLVGAGAPITCCDASVASHHA